MGICLHSQEEVDAVNKRIKAIKKEQNAIYRKQYKSTKIKGEKWQDIKNANYQISNFGRVRKADTCQILMNYSHNGYDRIKLKINGKWKNKYVHRLVAEAFVPNPNNLPCVNHINEIKTYNAPSNLEWCTHAHNTNHGTANKRRSDTAKLNNAVKRSGLVPPLIKLEE